MIQNQMATKVNGVNTNNNNPKEEKEMEKIQTEEILALTMDSTEIQEFAFVDNKGYSTEIIDAARAIYDLDRIESLKAQTDLTEFYAEGKKQILALCHADQALEIHSNLFRVQFQINVGNILNKIEPTFTKKSDYMTWVKDNFKDKHIRYFQQAKQLAAMGDFAEDYAAAGKNRLLALQHLRKVEKKTECEALFTDHPLPDTTEDEEGYLLKRHIDSVITLHRLRNAGVEFAAFDQAELIASYGNEALGVRQANEAKKWLGQYPEDQRPALFDSYVQDQLKYPSDHPYTAAPKASLSKVLADLLNCYGRGNLEDDNWIAKQRRLINIESLLSAQRLISQLIDRIRTPEPAIEVPAEIPATSPDETLAA